MSDRNAVCDSKDGKDMLGEEQGSSLMIDRYKTEDGKDMLGEERG